MKIERDGINVYIEDVSAILEHPGTFDPNGDFIQLTRSLAIEHTRAHQEEIREKIAEDREFPFEPGLLKRLSLLHKVANEDLSKYLIVSSREDDREDDSSPHRFVTYPKKFVPALRKYYLERSTGFLIAGDEARVDIANLPPRSPESRMADLRQRTARKSGYLYQTYYHRLRAIEDSSDVPTEN